MNSTSSLTLMTASVAVGAGEPIVEAALHEDNTSAFISPSDSVNLPSVLIIGDSISIGYTDPVRNNLKGIANVFRPPENCQHTGHGLANIKSWLGTGKWDVIHFNFGIWDTHLLDSKGNLLSGSMEGDTNNPTGGNRIRYTPEQCHFNVQGNMQLGKQVAECIQRAIDNKCRAVSPYTHA